MTQRAKKIGGSYQADGWVIAKFTTRAGNKRVVFEFEQPAGMLHIFNLEQVVVETPLQQAGSEGTHICTCEQYPHTDWCGSWRRL